jgi:glycosyltransferase involved in cell wall biosynthesis
MVPPPPTLTICMPTRNRQQHLERGLARVLEPGVFPFPIEVLVSDNASTDDTGAVVRRWIERGLPVRYQRHERNIGPYGNQFSALRGARGTYAIYHADDDGLHVDNLAEAVGWLEANPDCVASYGPLETIDAVDNVSQGLSYGIPADRVFDNRSRLALTAFMLDHHIIPELGIYRVSALANTLFVTHTLYWAYPLLDRLLPRGRVCFRAKPHYKSFIRQWVGDEARITGQQEFRLDDWESFYNGLRFFYYTALVSGETPASPAERAAIEAGLEKFGAHYRNQAINTIARTGRLSEVLDVIKLLSGSKTIDINAMVEGLAANSAAAALYTVIELFDQAVGTTRIAFHGFGAASEQMIRAVKSLRPDIEVVAAVDLAALGEPEQVLLVVPDDGLQQAAANLGFLPGRVLGLPAIMATFDVGRWLAFARG